MKKYATTFTNICSLLFAIAIIIFTSCRKDNITTDNNAKLSFSTDTLSFDTVFTTQGSVTYAFKVYNNNNEAVNISSIKLGGGSNSFFRLNIDGEAAENINNYVLRGKDSMYVFAEVTIDPNNNNNPFIIKDSVIFETNGNLQDVKLISWGQNAYYHGEKDAYTILRKSDFRDTTFIWKNDKPHVVYGLLIIDSAVTLQIQEGARIYMHGNSILYAYRNGKIQAIGNATQKIYFQQDRLEPMFKDIAGQWGGIWLQEGSTENIFENVEIKNADIGIILGGYLSGLISPNIATEATLIKVKIKNSARNAIFATSSILNAKNCLFYDSGKNLFAALKGGIYNITHCTFANTNAGTFGRQVPNILLANYAVINNNTEFADMNVHFYNNIIYGNMNDEIALEINNNAAYNKVFENNLIRTSKAITYNFSTSNIINENPEFENNYEEKFWLKNISVCKDAAMILNPLITDDFNSQNRDSNPDIGCFEYR